MGAATTEWVRSIGETIGADAIALRHDLHRCPELGGKKVRMQRLLCSEFDKLGVPYRCVVDAEGDSLCVS